MNFAPRVVRHAMQNKQAEPCQAPPAEIDQLVTLLPTRSTGTISTAATATATAAALFFGPRLVDGQFATLDVLSSETGDGGLGAFRSCHSNESETAGATAHAIHDEVDLSDRTEGCKHVLQVVLGGVEGKIPDV